MFVSLSLSRALFISPSPSVSLSVLAHHTSATRHILSPKSVGLRASGTLRGLWGSTSFLSPFFLFVRGTSRRIVEEGRTVKRLLGDYSMSCACCGSNYDYSVSMDAPRFHCPSIGDNLYDWAARLFRDAFVMQILTNLRVTIGLLPPGF